MAKVEIKKDVVATRVYVDGAEVPYVLAYSLHQSADKIPTVELELLFSEMQCSLDCADVQYSTNTVQQAVNVLRTELLKHSDLYTGFLVSIESAIKECHNESYSSELAESILKRLIGE